MSETIIVALIGLASAVIVALITAKATTKANKKANDTLSKEIAHKLEIAQAVTDTKIEELTREVREHNNFARRMPVVESEIVHIEADIQDLKKYHK